MINNFIIPMLLRDGMMVVPTPFNGRSDTGSLIFDITLPKNPVYYDDVMELYTDGAVYFKNKGLVFTPP